LLIYYLVGSFAEPAAVTDRVKPVASQQPELELSCFTEGNTTKRTRSERVLYFLIRTTVHFRTRSEK